MSESFDDFYKSMKNLVDSFAKKNLMLKVEQDLQSNIIRIFGEDTSALSRAKSGLDDVSELAYATAEHHPYWNLLYHASQISKTALEKWNSDLTKEELDEISWSIDELKNTCEKLKEKLGQNH
jgi:ubiquinone biosynthesis protein UbiJ